MPVSWNEIRHRAIAFSREWQGETREAAERQSFWNDFFNVFGVRRRTAASFVEHVASYPLAGNEDISRHPNRRGSSSASIREAMNGVMRILILVLCPVVLNVPRSALSQISLVCIGRTNDGGYASAVAVAGNYAYLANASDGLRTYDVSNPAHPVRVAQTTNGGIAFGLALSSNFVFVAQDHYGLGIYDISNPANPSLVGQATNDDVIPHSTAVVVSGNYAWLANASSGLWACDITDPANPLVVCQTTTNGGLFHSPIDVAVAGNYAYAACVFDGLRIYDISTPSSPIPLGQVTNSSGTARVLAVAGNYVYLGNSGDGLRIYDVSDPSNPVNVGYVGVTKPGNSYYAIKVAGNYAYVGATADGLHICDVADPANPVEVGSVNVGTVRGIALSGNYVYLANDTSGLGVYLMVPQLRIALTGTNTVLFSWPETPIAFRPQQNATLGPTDWATLTNAPLRVGAWNLMTLPPPATNMFYRLAQE